MMNKDSDKIAQSFKYAERQQDLVSVEQQEVLDSIIARLESFPSLTVTQVTPIWHIIEGHGKKVQLEVDNPGANLDIVEITEDDEPEELRFPRKSWGAEMAKLNKGNEEFAELKIIGKFAIRRV
jgi:HSP20 family molecular chaperone IbpA